MKRPKDMHDLFTLSPAAESKAAEGAESPGPALLGPSTSPVTTAKSMTFTPLLTGLLRRYFVMFSFGGECGSLAAGLAPSRPCCNVTAMT